MFQVQMSPPMVVGASTGTVVHHQRQASSSALSSIASSPTAASASASATSKIAPIIISSILSSSSTGSTPVAPPTPSPGGSSAASSTVVTPRPPPPRTISLAATSGSPASTTYRSELGRNLLLEHVLEQKRLNSPQPPPNAAASASGANNAPLAPKASAIRALSELPVPSRRFYDLPASLKEVFSELLEGRDHGVNWEEHNKLLEAQQAAEAANGGAGNEEHDEADGGEHIITPQQPSHALPTHHHTAADIAMLEHLSRPAHHKILKRATVLDLSRAGTVHLHADTDEVKLGDPPRILRDIVEKRDREAAEAKRLAEEALKPPEQKDQLQLLQENSSAPEIVQLREELAALQQKNDQEAAQLESERDQRQEADRVHEAHLAELSNPTPVPEEIATPVVLPVIPFELQGDLELYNSANVEKRINNKFHADFVTGVQKFWLTFDSHEMGTARQHHQLIIPRGNFIRMLILAYAYLYRDENALEKEETGKLSSPLGASTGMTLGSTLEPPHPFATSKLDAAKLHKALTADIKADVHQRSRGVTFVEFHEAMFQLVDQWTITVELADYVSFLELLYDAISRPSEARVQSSLAAANNANKSTSANNGAAGARQPQKPKKKIPRWGVGPDGSPILLNEDELEGENGNTDGRASRTENHNLFDDENTVEEDIELDANGQRRLLLVEHEKLAAASHTNSATVVKRASWIRNGSVTRTPVLGQRGLAGSPTASPSTQTTSLKSSPKTHTASILTGAGLELLGKDAREKVLEDMGSTYNSPMSPSRRAGWKLSLVKGDQSEVEKQTKSPSQPKRRSLTTSSIDSNVGEPSELPNLLETPETPAPEVKSPEDRKRDRLKAIVALTWSSSVTPGSKPRSIARPNMSVDVSHNVEEKQPSPTPTAASRIHTPGAVIANLGESLVPYDPMRLLSHIQVKHSGEVVRFQSPLRKTLARSRRNSLTNATPRPSIDATNIIESRAKSSGWGRSPPPLTQARTPDTASIASASASNSTSKATSRPSTRPSTRDGPRPGTADSLMVPSYSKPTSSSASRSPSHSPSRTPSPTRARSAQQVLVPSDPFSDPSTPGSTAPLFARRGSIPTPAPKSARQKQLDKLRDDLISQAREIENARAARLIVKVGAAQSAVNSNQHTDPSEIARLKAQLQQLDQTQITSIYGMAALSMSQQKQQRDAAGASGSQSARGASRREANFIEPPLTARTPAGSSTARVKAVTQLPPTVQRPTVQQTEEFRPWTASTDGGEGHASSVRDQFEQWQRDSVRSIIFTTPGNGAVAAAPLPTTIRKKSSYTTQWEQSHRASRRYRELLDAQLESDTHTNVVYRNCMFDAPPKAIRPRDGTADKSRRDELWYATLKSRKMDSKSRSATRPSSSLSTDTTDTSTGLGTIERVLEQNNSLTIRTNRPGSTHRPQSRSGGDIGTARYRFDTNERSKVRMGYVDPAQSFSDSAAMISRDQPISPTARLTIVRPNTAPLNPHSNDLIGFTDRSAEKEGEQTRPLSPVKADVHSVFKNPLSPYPPPHYRPFVNTSLNDVPRVQRREHVFTWKGLDQAEWRLLDRDELHRAPFQAETVPLYLKGALFTSVKARGGRAADSVQSVSAPITVHQAYDAQAALPFDTPEEVSLQQSQPGDDFPFEPVPSEVYSV